MKFFYQFLFERKVQVLIAILLLLALANLPYGYYQFLRIGVFIAAGMLAWRNAQVEGMVTWVYVMAGVALLFNPIFPIHFQRVEWAWLDIITAIIFLACPSAHKKKTSSEDNLDKNSAVLQPALMHDGSDYERAIPVSSVEQEYAWIEANFPKAKRSTQELVSCREGLVDVLEIQLQDGSIRKVYFDITQILVKWALARTN